MKPAAMSVQRAKGNQKERPDPFASGTEGAGWSRVDCVSKEKYLPSSACLLHRDQKYCAAYLPSPDGP